MARALALSPSEVSESLARCRYCRLLAAAPGAYQVQARALLEFLLHGLPYAFAVHPGAQARGLATGASAPPLSHRFGVEPAYVWPTAGEVGGAAVEPLYPGAVVAAQHDARLYELLALVDALRLGRPREHRLAGQLLTEALVPVSVPPHAA